ncbi:MAG: exo-alpha-sialidase [Clostridia bacterium]|nr:exo-alpha-sialidase [Clostridia bacterium]
MAYKSNAQEIRAQAKAALIHRDNALLPPRFLYDREALNGEKSPYSSAVRNFQGIPSTDCTKSGRIFTVFYTGKDDEGAGNYLLLQISEDGVHFGDPFMGVFPATEGVRCFDPGLWCAPDGRMFLFWNQSFGYFDGRSGVWCAVCEDPDAPEPRFGNPRRIANGVMMCKPIEKSDGDWLLPAAVWPMRPHYGEMDCDKETAWKDRNARYAEGYYYLPEEQNPNVYVSRNKGDTWQFCGQAKADNYTFPEHMVFEKTDGSLGMYIRCTGSMGKLGYAQSRDGGRTWTDMVLSELYNPCTRFCVRRLPSGRLLLLNHELVTVQRRDNLSAYLSEDDGKTWSHPLILDERPSVSYPDLAILPDGSLFAVYDHERYRDKEILGAHFTEEDILCGKPTSKQFSLRILVSRALGQNPRELPK